jgi:MFS family permease
VRVFGEDPLKESTFSVGDAARGLSQRYKVFAIVTLVNLTVWLDEGVFGALTPYWSRDLHLSVEQIGTASAAYLLTTFVMLFVGGVVSDLIGARRVLLVVVAGCAGLSAAMLMVNSYEQLVVRNLLFGVFFGGLWGPCNRMIAIWLPPKDRAHFAALWMSSTLFSFVLSNPVGLLIAEHLSWRSAFLFVTVLSLPSFLLLLWIRDRPEQLKSVTKDELKLIYVGRDVEKELDDERFHWRGALQALHQRSVLLMIIATALATTPTWLIVTWGTYGLLNGFKVGAAKASLLGDIGLMIPVLYGFAHGWVVNRVFGQRCRPALAMGPIIGGVGFLIAALYQPGAIVWALLIYGAGFLSDPFYWGTINAYWAGLTKPEYLGTLSGLSGACQTAVGYMLINASGSWVRHGVEGPEALRNIWLVGGCVFLLAAVPIYLAREVRTA